MALEQQLPQAVSLLAYESLLAAARARCPQLASHELTVRVAEVTQPGHAECYNAKLRAVTVVYDDGDTFVTAYPSDFHA